MRSLGITGACPYDHLITVWNACVCVCVEASSVIHFETVSLLAWSFQVRPRWLARSTTYLSPSPQCWDYKCKPPRLAFYVCSRVELLLHLSHNLKMHVYLFSVCMCTYMCHYTNVEVRTCVSQYSLYTMCAVGCFCSFGESTTQLPNKPNMEVYS